MPRRDIPNTSDAAPSIYHEALDQRIHQSRNPDAHSADSNTPLHELDLSPPIMLPPPIAARNGNHPIPYTFAQAFGERGAGSNANAIVDDADMITAVRFSPNTEMVATGDKGGRIVILKRVHRSKDARRTDIANVTSARRRRRASFGQDTPPADYYDFLAAPPEFRFWTQFQSHEPQFDYLKSMEIDEKINQIQWCREAGGSQQRLIAANEKTIKIWRVQEKEVRTLASMKHTSPQRTSRSLAPRTTLSSESPHRPDFTARPLRKTGSSSGGLPGSNALRLPELKSHGRVITATPRREYSSAHSYHINSISLNSDEETFLSADDLRVHFWNLERGGGFNIMDIKPNVMDDLTEVVTSAEFHPQHCQLFLHSNSRGVVKIADLRTSALCKTWARKLETPDDRANRQSFFSEIIASISDARFSPDGRYILTRDYMKLRLWDINMERAPVMVIPVHDHLRSRLCDLYENDCIFDKFQCCFSKDGGSLLTGSYNSLFQAYSAQDGSGTAVEASVDFVSRLSRRNHFTSDGFSNTLLSGYSSRQLMDPTRRIMHLDSSTTDDISAVAAGPALYVYYKAGRRR